MKIFTINKNKINQQKYKMWIENNEYCKDKNYEKMRIENLSQLAVTFQVENVAD